MRSFIFNINAFCCAKSFLHILQSKIFHICRKANISRGEAVFHPFRKEWISPKTPAAFLHVHSLRNEWHIKPKVFYKNKSGWCFNHFFPSHLPQGKYFTRRSRISSDKVGFPPFRKEWISLKTPAAFSTPAFALNALLITNYCLRKWIKKLRFLRWVLNITFTP